MGLSDALPRRVCNRIVKASCNTVGANKTGVRSRVRAIRNPVATSLSRDIGSLLSTMRTLPFNSRDREELLGRTISVECNSPRARTYRFAAVSCRIAPTADTELSLTVVQEIRNCRVNSSCALRIRSAFERAPRTVLRGRNDGSSPWKNRTFVRTADPLNAEDSGPREWWPPTPC